MIFAGIDVAKDKHDCCILNSDGEVLVNSFTFTNDMDGFSLFFQRLMSVESDLGNVKVGLEATGHYSYNITGFLLDKGLTPFIINPLHSNLFRNSTSLRRTKTDKVDARIIAAMLAFNVVNTPYSATSYHNEELKSLTRYRFNKVQECAKYKASVSRLVTILFPELAKMVSTLHSKSVYALLSELPGAKQIASCHLTHLTHLLSKASMGRYKKAMAVKIRDAARRSIGSIMPAKSLELKHTIKMIQIFSDEIDEIESLISQLIKEIPAPLFSIPGIGPNMGAMIIAEIGDFSRFDSPDKILAFAGYSPSTYQSGKLNNAHSHMEKRGSKYLRYALYNAAQKVCNWDTQFGSYLAKKLSEGKHYYVAISHVVKKLVRVIYAIQKSGKRYCKSTEGVPFEAGA